MRSNVGLGCSLSLSRHRGNVGWTPQSLIGQPGMPGATHGSDTKRQFDRELIVGMVAELQGIIKAQDEKLTAQSEKMHSLELNLAAIQAASDLRDAEDRHTSVKLAEHQIAIAELRRLLNAETAKVIDLPDVLQRRGLN
jgi:hypothetical protein